MSGVKRKRNVLNVKQKLEILQKFGGSASIDAEDGESVSTDAEDVLNEGNTIYHSATLQSVETLLDYMGQRGFEYGDITAVRKICVDIRQEMNKEEIQRRITDFFKQ
ncbi:hypothetical protein AVEN_49231-1 [Araneus ventricosus]|uniref:HTH psq-type domain-containing protein n=1 Tax=Araneus ventricosus TaxID=182803 RepID=A0A4Y2RB22_ARAVE|nr:hypothetical protein AVEN_97241-1 [Araneus ventricosus]GBN72967.1 hypothetical protein AVEN_248748-1 [Araneus ventricosus]GBN72974.1 hypothetical protein AVEN_267207-1 [Araneus ventricosus]GBN72983.1 hypothetical protein AVEN_49231-1 [Araneus ventricosus]